MVEVPDGREGMSRTGKPGRDDLCPCGSERRYRYCCQKVEDARKVAQAAYNRALKKLLEFTFSPALGSRRAEALFQLEGGSGTVEIEEWEQPTALAFLAHGFRGRDGNTVLDHFMKKHRHALSRDETDALMDLGASWPSLFEGEKVHPEEGIDLHDVVLDERFFVHDVASTRQVKRWDLLFGWVFRRQNEIQMVGASYLVPRDLAAPVLDSIFAAMKEHRAHDPKVSDRTALAAVAWAANVALRKAYREAPATPKMMNTAGEEVLFCEARYEIDDPRSVRKALAEVKHLMPDGGDFVWLDSKKVRKGNQPNLLRGVIRIGEHEIVLETNSRERLQEGKKLLEGALGSLILRMPTESLQHLRVALAEAEERSVSSKDPPPPGTAAVIEKLLQKHYEDWIDHPLPVFNGKTPREMARSVDGRKTVEALLKDMENRALWSHGEVSADFDKIRRELKIPVRPRSRR